MDIGDRDRIAWKLGGQLGWSTQNKDKTKQNEMKKRDLVSTKWQVKTVFTELSSNLHTHIQHAYTPL